MSNYIKSELFRLRKSKVLWGVLALALSWVVFQLFNEKSGNAMMELIKKMDRTCFLTVFIGLVVVADGFKKHTIKNDLAYGISENKIYFSKIIVSMIIGLVLFVAVDVIAIPAYCLFNGGKNAQHIGTLLQSEGIMFVACVAATVCFITIFFIFKNSIVAVFGWFVLLQLLSPFIEFLMGKFNALYNLDSVFEKTVLSYILSNKGYVNNVFFAPWLNANGCINIILSSAIMIITCLVCKLVINKKIA